MLSSLHIFSFFVCENISFSKFQLYNTGLSVVVTMLYIISSDFIHLSLKDFTFLTNSPYSPHHSYSRNHVCTLCFYEFDF